MWSNDYSLLIAYSEPFIWEYVNLKEIEQIEQKPVSLTL